MEIVVKTNNSPEISLPIDISRLLRLGKIISPAKRATKVSRTAIAIPVLIRSCFLGK